MDTPDNTFIAGMDMPQYIYNRYEHALDNTFTAGMGMLQTAHLWQIQTDFRQYSYGRYGHNFDCTLTTGTGIPQDIHKQKHTHSHLLVTTMSMNTLRKYPHNRFKDSTGMIITS